jgi:hypothetical protein
MAKRKEDWAKVKVWTPTMTSDFEGPRLACAIELFGTLNADERKRALVLMALRDTKTIEQAAKNPEQSVAA